MNGNKHGSKKGGSRPGKSVRKGREPRGYVTKRDLPAGYGQNGKR